MLAVSGTAAVTLWLTKPTPKEFESYATSKNISGDYYVTMSSPFFYSKHLVVGGSHLDATHCFIGVLGHFYECKVPESKLSKTNDIGSKQIDDSGKAEAGDSESQTVMGNRYFKGDGVVMDRVEAVKWYRKAAEQNNAEAQCTLGVCYLTGQGVQQDSSEGLKWIQKAADQNDARAEQVLGNCYLNGNGAEKDEVEAARWLRKAAEQDYVEAERDLGMCYQDGLGVQQDYVEAVKWMQKAAEHGDYVAQYGLGVRYANGEGIGKDEIEGYKWMLLAAAQGDERLKKYVTSIEAGLSAEQLADGKRRANDWLKNHKGISPQN